MKAIINFIRKIILKFLSDDGKYVIGVDYGYNADHTVFVLCKITKGKIEVLIDEHLKNNCNLRDFQMEIIQLSKQYNAHIVEDFPPNFRPLIRDRI